VGLGVDCTPWVAKGLISHEGMRDRNWVFWTTFCQVCEKTLLLAELCHSRCLSGCDLVSLCRPRLQRLVVGERASNPAAMARLR